MSTTEVPSSTSADPVGERQRLGHVDRAGVGQRAQPRPQLADALEQGARDVPAVQRQQRDEVEARTGRC